ncbi:baseplate J/gp47 family protein [Paraburkholderia terrae]|uniref:hypothetical protein n=1 Tax=Paraburkholderia terrae TaxID=311230 RepID=UPI00296A9496|nr:hypothetical protein [Paraburkholderia terrae]MDW3660606.1 hypothetical protein [Paraburkholderia terrae]
MRTPGAPGMEPRRAPDFAAELIERARVWIPSWALDDNQSDFGRALMEIAARFSSEVAERLDGAGEKMHLGLLDWLAVQGEAARPAHMPVTFKLADTARVAVPTFAPVRMQVDVGDASIIFETDDDVRLVPGRLEMVVGVDTDADAFFVSPPGFTSLDPLEPVPTVWSVKTFASGDQAKVQLDPQQGLQEGLIVRILEQEYCIDKVDADIATLDRNLPASGVPRGTVVRKVDTFVPFSTGARNLQEHALYIGHVDLLNVQSAATIEVVGVDTIRDVVTWQYWGRSEEAGGEVGWQPLMQMEDGVAGAVVLDKPAGAVEPLSIGAAQSCRWIRAWMKKVADRSKPMLAVDALRLRINASGDAPPCPVTGKASPGVKVQAMANNTPLVLSTPFYPLGREPRQFDAFYLGSAEAFSKKSGAVQICIELADATCTRFTAVRSGRFANRVLAGVGADGALHMFSLNQDSGELKRVPERGPLRPPLPAVYGATTSAQPQSVNLNPRCTPLIWSTDNDFHIAVAAGGEVWVWHEYAFDAKQSGWQLHSMVPRPPGSTEQIEDLVALGNSAPGPAAALCNGRLWIYRDATWRELTAGRPAAEALPDFALLVPIRDAKGDPTGSMLAASLNRKLYRVDSVGKMQAIKPEVEVDIGQFSGKREIPVGGMRPVAIEFAADDLRVVTVDAARAKLVAVGFDSSRDQGIDRQEIDLMGEARGMTIDARTVGGTWQYTVRIAGATGSESLGSWLPAFNNELLFEYALPEGRYRREASSATIGSYVLFPGGRGDAYVARFDDAWRLPFNKPIVEGIIVRKPPPFAVDDFISALVNSERKEWQLANPGRERGNEVIFLVDSKLGSLDAQPEVVGFRPSKGRTGKRNTITKFALDATDAEIVEGMVLRITLGTGAEPGFYPVVHVDSDVNPVIVTVKGKIPGKSGDPLEYMRPIFADARVVPAIEFAPLGDGNWDALILDHAKVYVPGPPAPKPSPQEAVAFGIVDHHPAVLALKSRWTAHAPAPGAQTSFIIDGYLGAWQQQLPDTASNPELSWEYSNGKGWWSLEVNDGTQRLANTGVVSFTVPSDIAESDWSGQKNFWIRARLVGGDYGHEDVKVVSRRKPGTRGEFEQVVVRSSENVRAPQALSLNVSYRIADAMYPTYVLAADSGTYRDQSDANRTPGAIVEAFVPLAVTLNRLRGTGQTPAADDSPCPSSCHCEPSASPGYAAQDAQSSHDTATPAADRAIYLGSSAQLSGGPLRVLFPVAKEHDFGDASALDVAALVAGQFVPVVASDETSALGESGLLTFALGTPTTMAELFGRELHWLRLAPLVDAGSWMPELRGAYLNSVWASAAETLTRELLGSSEGAPNIVLNLARPPVLRNTLKLRIREPLGNEEREALRREDKMRVLSDVENLPGDWVLWEQVVDPGDERPDARVYALDEATGEVRFGDGQHGKIPPAGRDSIVAFSYRRTEVGPTGSDSVPGNEVVARSTLNLVSPVETVEAVLAAEQAAGGAPAEQLERVMRFGTARLRHRNRAVTARDFEDLSLQSSPDIVQACCLEGGRDIRLVVVMRGVDPVPNAAQIRELQRYLLAAAAPSLSEHNVLRITGPVIRSLCIDLLLRVANLDDVGELSDDVMRRLAAFFDTSAGGVAQRGWTLGDNPDDGDIALALIDSPRLEGIVAVTLSEAGADGARRPWTRAIGPDELAMLADDGISIRFTTVGAAS